MESGGSIFKKTGLFVVSMFVVVMVAKILSPQFFSSPVIPKRSAIPYVAPQSYVESQLTIKDIVLATADSINKKCPIYIDSLTEITYMSVPADSTLQYNFTIKADKTRIDVVKLKKLLESNLEITAATTDHLKIFMDSSMTLVYRYEDINKGYLVQCVMTPERYKNINSK